MEVPGHLTPHTATGGESLAQGDEAGAAGAEVVTISTTESVEALPAQCQDCAFRPTSAGGNNGCLELNQTYSDIETVEQFLRMRSDWQNESSFSPVLGVALGLQLLIEKRENQRGAFAHKAPAALQPDELAAWDVAKTSLGHVSLASRDTVAFLRNTFAVEDVGTRSDTPSPCGIEVYICIKSLSNRVKPEGVTDRDGYADFAKMVTAARAITAAKKAGVTFS